MLIRIHHDGALIQDGPGPLGQWIDGDATFHLGMRTDQLRALLRDA